MRYNEKELVCLSRQPAEKAAELVMRGPKRSDAAKCRLVKLVVNFLFYFRIDEEEPVGALLLEQCKIQKEDDTGFSLVILVLIFLITSTAICFQKYDSVEKECRDLLPSFRQIMRHMPRTSSESVQS